MEATTAEDTTAEATTIEATTAENTTAEATTIVATTIEATTAEATTAEATTAKTTANGATTEEVTTAEATTEKTTANGATTEEVTTAEATTEEDITSEATTIEASTVTEKVTTTTKAGDNLGHICDYNFTICSENSFCVPDGDGYSCLCYPGFVDDNSQCVKVRQFTGAMILSNTLRFSRSLKAENVIVDEIKFLLDDIYGTTSDYKKSDVLDSGDNKFEYLLIFNDAESITEVFVKNQFVEGLNERCLDGSKCSLSSGEEIQLPVNIEESIELFGADSNLACPNCDHISTNCNTDRLGDAFCSCKTGFYKPNEVFEVISCAVEVCMNNDDCNAPFGTCDVINGEPNHCVCIATFSGEHCKNSWQFVFVIVTPVLLLVIIILTFYFCRKRSEPVKYVEIDSNQKLRNFESYTQKPVEGLRARTLNSQM